MREQASRWMAYSPIESVVWSGLAIDADFKVWQRDEEPIDILKMPYQSLKTMLLKTAA